MRGMASIRSWLDSCFPGHWQRIACHRWCFLALISIFLLFIIDVRYLGRLKYVSSISLKWKVKPPLHDSDLKTYVSSAKMGNLSYEPFRKKTRVIKPFKYSVVTEKSMAVLNSNFFNVNCISDFHCEYTILPKDTCQNDTFLVIIVPTVYGNFLFRDVIRNTWGSFAQGRKWPGSDVIIHAKLLFVFGQSSSPSIKEQLRLENQIHGDILQSYFLESYSNLTLKVLSSLRFVQQYCPSVEYVFKLDDDTFTDVDLLVRFLMKVRPRYSVMGYIVEGSHVHRQGKYSLSQQVYPLDVYPIYTQGEGYVLSVDIIPCIMRYASCVSYFRIEDAFITGVLGRICQVSHICPDGFRRFLTPKSPGLMLVEGEVILFHTYKPEIAWQFWKYIEAFYK